MPTCFICFKVTGSRGPNHLQHCSILPNEFYANVQNEQASTNRPTARVEFGIGGTNMFGWLRFVLDKKYFYTYAASYSFLSE